MDLFDAFDPFDFDGLDDLEATEGAGASEVTPRRLIILWLLAAGLLFSLFPLSMMSKALLEETAAAALEIERYEAEPLQTPTPPLELQPLLSTLEAVRNGVIELGGAETAMKGSLGLDVYWPDVIAVVGAYDPEQIVLSAFRQSERQITLEGSAVADAAIADYTRLLETSGVFSRVLVKSITLVETGNLPAPAPATATAAATAAAATATPPSVASPLPEAPVTVPATAEVGLRDAYEVDDFVPVDIILGQPQRHTFFPIYDIDRVRFLAKRGRHYRVYTTDLDPGVDTQLAVEVGGRVVETNDDIRARDLSSEVVVTMMEPDAYAVVIITNRGPYGPDLGYSVVVEEVLAAPTPVPTSTPSETATPTPTATPTHTATPTAKQLLPTDLASRRLPGLARLRVFHDLQQVPEGWGPGAVEFVIVLELREGCP